MSGQSPSPSMPGSAFERVLDALGRIGRVTRREGSAMAQCPAHEDNRASLSITRAADRVLLKCHAGCAIEHVLERLGLAARDLFDEKTPARTVRRIVATYSYVDEAGVELFQCVRYEPKDFRQRRPDPAKPGSYIWNLTGVRLVLYRLPAVVAAVKAGATVYVAEGEKDVEALERAGVVATTSPMGAGKWRPQYGEILSGADVVIVAHRDLAGEASASEVARDLGAHGVRVQIVRSAVGNDAFDHLAAGRGVSDFEPATLADLEASVSSRRLEAAAPEQVRRTPTGSTTTFFLRDDEGRDLARAEALPDGRLQFWTGRHPGLEGLPTAELLYGREHERSFSTAAPVFLVDGPVAAAALAGPPLSLQVLGIMGVGKGLLADSHIKRIASYSDLRLWPAPGARGESRMARLASALRRAGAKSARVLHASAAPIAFAAAGGTREEALKVPGVGEEPSLSRYAVIDGAIVERFDDHDVVVVNAEIHIEKQYREAFSAADPNRDTTHARIVRFDLEARLAGEESWQHFSVEARDYYKTVEWLTDHLGTGARLRPGRTSDDILRNAISELSGDVPIDEIYRFYGYAGGNGRRMHLSPGGAITAQGLDTSVVVSLGERGETSRFDRDFGFRRIAEGDDLRRGYEAILDLRRLAPARITVPSLGLAFAAPLLETSFVLYLLGPTQIRKSTFAALLQSLFGHGHDGLTSGGSGFDYDHLPLSLSDTAKGISSRLAAAGDVLVVVDDVSANSPGDRAKKVDAASRIVRDVGNRDGNNKLRRDSSFLEGPPPRGAMLLTGILPLAAEDVKARTLGVDVADGDIARLDDQGMRVALAAARDYTLSSTMAAFIRHLISEDEVQQMERVRENLDRLRRQVPEKGRLPTVIAELGVAWMEWLRFGLVCSLISAERSDALFADAWVALLEAASRHSASLRESSPVVRFRRALHAALASGTAHLATRDGGVPTGENAGAWGWRADGFGSVARPQARRIGWVDPPYDSTSVAYLEMTTALSVADSALRDADESVGVGELVLNDLLAHDGWVARSDSERRTTKVVLDGARRRVLAVNARFLLDVEEEDPPGGRASPLGAGPRIDGPAVTQIDSAGSGQPPEDDPSAPWLQDPPEDGMRPEAATADEVTLATTPAEWDPDSVEWALGRAAELVATGIPEGQALERAITYVAAQREELMRIRATSGASDQASASDQTARPEDRTPVAAETKKEAIPKERRSWRERWPRPSAFAVVDREGVLLPGGSHQDGRDPVAIIAGAECDRAFVHRTGLDRFPALARGTPAGQPSRVRDGVDLVFIQRWQGESFGHAVDGAALARMVQAFEDLIRFELRHSIPSTAEALLVALHERDERGTRLERVGPPTVSPLKTLPPGARALEWIGPQNGAGQFVHQVDKNVAYNAAAETLEVGYGASELVDAPAFDKNLPAWWNVKLPASDGLPAPIFSGDWHATPTVALTAELGALPPVQRAYVWRNHGRYFGPFVKRLRRALEACTEIDEEIRPDVRDALKLAYKSLLGGRLLSRTLRGPLGYRPDWSGQLLARFNANLARNILDVRRESGLVPFAVKIDSLFYRSDEPDARQALRGLRFGDRPGEWSHEATVQADRIGHPHTATTLAKIVRKEWANA